LPQYPFFAQADPRRRALDGFVGRALLLFEDLLDAPSNTVLPL
jgi:hypothetical protein